MLWPRKKNKRSASAYLIKKEISTFLIFSLDINKIEIVE